MKPLSSHSIMEALALGTVPVVGVFLIWSFLPVHGIVKQTGQSSAQILTKISTALDTVNAPCHDDGHQEVCGTLAEVGQTTKNTGVLAAQGASQVKQSAALITAAANTINSLGSKGSDELVALKGATDAFGGTARAASATLADHVDPAIDAVSGAAAKAGKAIDLFKPVEASAAKSMQDLDITIVDFKPTLTNLQTFSFSLGDMTAVADKKFDAFMNPPKCVGWKCHVARDWSVVNAGSKLVEPAYWAQQLLENHVP